MQKTLMRDTLSLLACIAALMTGGCGGGSSSSAGASGGSTATASPTYYSVGGMLSGLNPGETLTIADNGTDRVTFSGNGPFTFSAQLLAGTSYDVSVQSHSPGIACSVSNGTGVISTNVTNVAVSCTAGGETVLYSFGSGTDAQKPNGGLAMDGAGNLYGATEFGGAYNVGYGGDGAVFKISAADTESILHSFGSTASDGTTPTPGLVMDSAGNVYGTTADGGAYGDGTVFELSANGTETILYAFAGGTTDGANPEPLVVDGAGNFFGVTDSGGANGDGTVFELSASGTETLLYSFAGGTTDGAMPQGPLVMDSAGDLFGATEQGGAYGEGTVFEIRADGTETVLHSFSGGTADGATPIAGLTMDAAGDLYGATLQGGVYGYGTVFEVAAGGTESVLHSFVGGTSDGASPGGPLVMDAAGNLYGTAPQAGAHGYGAVFELSAAGAETLLYSFTGGPADGGNPTGSLLIDGAGNIYGTTELGGPYGTGTVFEIN